MKYMEIHIGGHYKMEIHIQGGYYKIIRLQNSKDSQSSSIILVLGVSPQTFMFPHVHLTKNQFLRWKCGCLAVLSSFGSPFWNGLTTKEPLVETARNKLLNLENHDLTLREASLTRTSSTIKHNRTTQTMPVGLRVHTLPPGLNLVCFLMSLMSFWGLLKSLWQPRIHACLSWLIDISYDRSDIMWFENWGPFRSTETNTKSNARKSTAWLILDGKNYHEWLKNALLVLPVLPSEIFCTWFHIFQSLLNSRKKWKKHIELIWQNVKLNYLHKDMNLNIKRYLLDDQWKI